MDIIGVLITVADMNSAVEYLTENLDDARGKYICISNVHTTVMAHEETSYREIQNGSFMSLPDGKPLSVIGRRRGYKNMDRVTGPDFMEKILARPGYRHYFYGNTKENLETLISYLRKRYPDLKIAGYEPSLFRELSSADEDALVSNINNSGADFIWVGIGAPRQEILSKKLSGKTNSVFIGVGGAFNVICGIIPRAPQWMQDHSLEWLYRWIQEPRRLFKRYIVSNTKFIWYLFLNRIAVKFSA